MVDTNQRQIPSEILGVIDDLRARIRRYVWLEGISVALIWIGLTFWIGLALDYLPVIVGASEMPREARVVLLVVISAVLFFILYRWIFRRAFERFSASSLAVLVERQFPEFRDSLVTSVELSEKHEVDPLINTELLDATRSSATRQITSVELSRIFDFRPLFRSFFGACLFLGSIALFGFLSSDALATWTSRMYLLSDQPWPRQARIELLGFDEREKKVAEGDDVIIRVRADEKHFVPDVCTIVYDSENGDQGRVNMSKDGETRDGFQYYVYDNTPFKGILDTVTFDVIGFDHRLRDYRILVVPSPVLVDVQLECEPPAYTGRLRRTEKWMLGSRFPMGSRIKVIAKANKPLTRVSMVDVGSPDTEHIEVTSGESEFTFEIADLRERVAKSITLRDADGISSQQPFRLVIGVIEDRAPEVGVSLRGISDVMTPDASIPVEGIVDDDYLVDHAWFDIQIVEKNEYRKFPITGIVGGELNHVLDLREKRTLEEDPLELQPGQNILLTVRANDRCDLDGNPNTGISDEFPIRIVEASELLARLEARELSLRRLFEQIISEMSATRDSLVKAAGPPPESLSRTEDSESVASRWDIQRQRRLEQALNQSEKSRLETDGVTRSFEAIREELINNRVDTEERKSRLQQQIIEPLKDIVDIRFPDLDDAIQTVASNHTNDLDSTGSWEPAINRANELVAAMEQVLEKMKELETYNELVDLVRTIIRQQQELLEKTKEERKKQAKSLLE